MNSPFMYALCLFKKREMKMKVDYPSISLDDHYHQMHMIDLSSEIKVLAISVRAGESLSLLMLFSITSLLKSYDYKNLKRYMHEEAAARVF